jgi:hypothetical protein
MRQLFIIITFLVIIFTACEKDKAPISGCTDSTAFNYNSDAIVDDGSCEYNQSVSTNLTIDFTQTVNANNLILGLGCLDGNECLPDHACCLGTLPYTNNAGQKYNIKKLWYLISNITLHTEVGTENLIKNIHFIDVSDPTTLSFLVSDLEDNNYTSISYTIGLDTTRNTSNEYVNEDFHTKMFWPELMGGGYHYMKLEGNYIKLEGGSNNDAPFYNTHTGGTMGVDYSFNHSDEISLITDNTTSEVSISINMEVNNWYQNPNSITLSSDGIMSNMTMQIQLNENGIDVFSTLIN